ncbi:MAG TPA: NUDIX domain-containing protein [Patescibacteria group bacterium]|nr:NUDIX domain-containing protein [Patescibacteria group bacterium]
MSNKRQKYPPVVVVDENDNQIGLAPLDEIWQKGLYHRIVSVFVEDDLGRMLLQRRSSSVGIYPNLWDQAAGGHVDEGQTYDQAARNEVAEELGLQDVELKVMGTHRYNGHQGSRIINQFERVYLARIPHDAVLRPETTEVDGLQWFTPTELKARIAANPELFTPGLLYCLREYFNLLGTPL